MDVFKNTKKFNKLIIVLVILILFEFCYPTVVRAGDMVENVLLGGVWFLYYIPYGTIKIVNKIFVGKSEERTQSSDTDEIVLSPENIIKGKFLLMDANIFKDLNTDTSTYFDTNSTGVKQGKVKLREVISGWYYALRNFAIVSLLSVLIYIAIRMILSTVSSDKAKYKMMFKDWLVALCLVFAMHYLMTGVLNISRLITEAIGITGHQTNMTEKLSNQITSLIQETSDLIDDNGEDENQVYAMMGDAMGLVIVFYAVVIFTIIFTIKYIVRALTITFLVLLAPISCITYPIDKLGDGKSQAFNVWLREFIMQVIIQPFHLLIYVVLIGAATELATTNIIYSIMCFAIMLPAEKFVKQMFGINEKLGSPLGAMATGAAMTSLLKKGASAIGGGKSGGSGSGSGSDNSSGSEDSLPPRQRGSLDDYEGGSSRDRGLDSAGHNDNNSSENNNEEENDRRRLPRGQEPQSADNDTEENNNQEDTADSVGENPDQITLDEVIKNNKGEGTTDSQEGEEETDDNIDSTELPEGEEKTDDNIDSTELPEGDDIDSAEAEQPKYNMPIRQMARAIKEEAGKAARKKFGTTDVLPKNFWPKLDEKDKKIIEKRTI